MIKNYGEKVKVGRRPCSLVSLPLSQNTSEKDEAFLGLLIVNIRHKVM